MIKPLKILLANNTLSLLAGSETWTYTLAVQLKKLGHKVHCFSPELGIISDELEKEGIISFNEILTSGVKPFSFVFEEEIDKNYDVIIANHWHIIEHLRDQYPRTPIISTIHGIIHNLDNGEKAPEHPSLDSGVNQFIAVSEEVSDLLKLKYNIDSIIIRNFIDINRFKEKRKIFPGKPKQFLINSNYNNLNDPEISVIKEVAKHYGAKLTAIGQNFTQSFDLSKAINDSDIVVGMGRSVLEGVAAGRIGIVHGRWGTGGIINKKNIEEIRKYNFSGRNNNGLIVSKEQLISMIDENYNQETADWGKNYIKRDHNSIFAADMYLNIAKELTGQNINQKVDPYLMPYKRQKDV